MKYTIEDVATITHEINRAYCVLIGDSSQVTWAESPDWQRQSAIAGVRFHLQNPDATPEDSHKAWLEQKKADGWVYSALKDATLKLHPCMVNYDALPVTQRAKDYIFSAVVAAYRDDIVY